MSIIIDKNKCVGCKKCSVVCPGSLIKTDENNKAYIKYPKDCWRKLQKEQRGRRGSAACRSDEAGGGNVSVGIGF